MPNLSRDYLEARSLFDDFTPNERLTYARVLYGMNFSPSEACTERPHPLDRSPCDESKYCTHKDTCSCDCHLAPEEYLDLHKEPTP